MRATILLIISVVLFFAAIAPSEAPTTVPSRTVWDGVYSNEQLARGEKMYMSLCARCHGDNLLGNDDAPTLVDNDFLSHWYDKPLGKLVDLTWKKMPTDGPGRLSRRQSTDITTYLLHENGFPVGNGELVPDAAVLNGILIEAKK
jgi:mono/diheme cytochrome c family protein